MARQKIILGITSSVAIYRSCDLIRAIRKADCNIRVVMTENANQLIRPILFQALSNEKVYYETFDLERVGVSHIDLARWADILVIAPATANIIGKLAAGIADDLLTTLVLAFNGPRLIVPAMNDVMWQNMIVEENCRRLKDRGFNFVGPIKGPLATGEVAIGHIAPVEMIWPRIKALLDKKKMVDGHRFLVAGGRTEAGIDPVRVITNRASGRMGLACAEAIIGRGGEVTLVTGPTEVAIPDWIPHIRIRDSRQLKVELKKRLKNHDCLIMATAVSDFQTRPRSSKIKKEGMEVRFKRTTDIIKTLNKEGIFTIGFSVETDHHLSHGRKKLRDKGLDLIVVNTPEAIGADTTRAWIVDSKGSKKLGRISKGELADLILDRYLSWLKGS